MSYAADGCDCCPGGYTYPPYPCPNICGYPIWCGPGDPILDWRVTGYWVVLSGSWSVGASKYDDCAAGIVTNYVPTCDSPESQTSSYGGDGHVHGCNFGFSLAVTAAAAVSTSDYVSADPENPMSAVGDTLTQYDGDMCGLGSTCSCESPAVPPQDDTNTVSMGGTFTYTEIMSPSGICYDGPTLGGLAYRQCANQFILTLSCHHATGRPVATVQFNHTSQGNAINGTAEDGCTCVQEYVEKCVQPAAYACSTPVADEEKTLTYSGTDWVASMTFKFVGPVP